MYCGRKAKQSKAKQSTAKQSQAKQNKTKEKSRGATSLLGRTMSAAPT